MCVAYCYDIDDDDVVVVVVIDDENNNDLMWWRDGYIRIKEEWM